jgi:large subunit ribosomal protein L24
VIQMKRKFSPSWKSSKQPRKQRKYRYNAPLHIKGKFVNAHLSAELRKKCGKRSIRLRTGDKIKVMSGGFKGQVSKVERISLKDQRVYITKIENVKKDGTKRLVAVHPSNLMIIELALDDKIRQAKMEKKE